MGVPDLRCSYPVAVIIDQWNALCVLGSVLDPKTEQRRDQVPANDNPLANLFSHFAGFRMVRFVHPCAGLLKDTRFEGFSLWLSLLHSVSNGGAVSMIEIRVLTLA